MIKYVALLRGINVSGQKIIKMDALRASLNKLGYANIQTYIQSGNVIFETEEGDKEVLESQIHQNILDTFEFDVPVIVRSRTDWEETFANNLYVNDRQEEITKLYVVLLSKEPAADHFEELKTFHQGSEEFVKHGLNLYLLYPNGAGKSRFDLKVIERKLKVKGTARNWKTTTKLMEMLNGEQ